MPFPSCNTPTPICTMMIFCCQPILHQRQIKGACAVGRKACSVRPQCFLHKPNACSRPSRHTPGIRSEYYCEEAGPKLPGKLIPRGSVLPTVELSESPAKQALLWLSPVSFSATTRLHNACGLFAPACWLPLETRLSSASLFVHSQAFSCPGIAR